MKYCSKCGNQMADDMLFCQKCGTKSVVSESVTNEEVVEKKTTYEPIPKVNNSSYASAPQKSPKKSNLRTSMKVWMIVCFVFAGLYALVSFAETAIISMTIFFWYFGYYVFLFGKDSKR